MRIIETERLLVRSFRTQDWRSLQEYVSQESVMKFESAWNITDDGCKKLAKYFSQGNTFWAVELKSMRKMIGHIYFAAVQPKEFMTWEIGYIFNPGYYGNGYASEAAECILQYAFEKLGAHRVVANCNPFNITSWKLLERISMRREGYSKSSISFRKDTEGKPIWWDQYHYAILQNEWKGFECQYIEGI